MKRQPGQMFIIMSWINIGRRIIKREERRERGGLRRPNEQESVYIIFQCWSKPDRGAFLRLIFSACLRWSKWHGHKSLFVYNAGVQGLSVEPFEDVFFKRFNASYLGPLISLTQAAAEVCRNWEGDFCWCSKRRSFNLHHVYSSDGVD